MAQFTLADVINRFQYQDIKEWDKSRFYNIGGALKELYCRRVEEAKQIYLSENALLISQTDKEAIFAEGSEGYEFVVKYANTFGLHRHMDYDDDFYKVFG